jgi:hypothetical protein
MTFQTLLKQDTWESVYIDTNPNRIFNSFLCTFLIIFPSSFPVKDKSMKDMNECITQGMKNLANKKEVWMPWLKQQWSKSKSTLY